MEIQQALNLLGMKVEDKVTKFRGVVTTVAFDLFGCIQVGVTPEVQEGKKEGSHWFDTVRMRFLESKPVMDRPDFVEEEEVELEKVDHFDGPAEKPLLP